MTPLKPQRPCPRFTGGWLRSGDRDVWTGERGEKQMYCGYAGDAHELLCHLIATHRIPLEAARASVKELVP